ncbi:MAG: TetR/AcrR family transcriptional regulator [Deinococcota bacterium]
MTRLQNKRNAILKATLELLIEYDLQSTSMTRIATHANVGMGTIYNYFESKEALVSTLFNEIHHAMITTMFTNYPEQAGIQERFFHVWRLKCKYFIEHPQEFIFVERFTASPYVKPNIDKTLLNTLAQLDIMFEDAKQQGLLKQLPKSFFIPIVNGSLGALIRSHVMGTIVLDEDAIELAIHACWDAVKS